MSSAGRFYRLHVALALLGAAAVLAAAIVAITRISPDLPSAAELLAACQGIVPAGPSLEPLLVLPPAAVGLAVALRGARSLWRQVRAQRRFLRALRTAEARAIDGTPVTVIHGAEPKAFCAGLLRPRIYVSTAALSVLTPTELAAVAAHEAHHHSRRDPLRILAARALAEALFFLPALRKMAPRYAELAELAADEAATEAKGRSALASALLRFAERGGAAPVAGIAPERVEQLLGRAPRRRLPLSLLGGSLVIVAGLAGLVLIAPALVEAESVRLATVVTESCMVAIALAPLAIAASALWVVGATTPEGSDRSRGTRACRRR